jgi:Holliday junction resolvase
MNTVQEELDPRVRTFLSAIEAALPAYRYADISFVAIEHEGYETILRASLRLSAEPLGETRPARSISCIRAAQVLWTGRADAIANLVWGILKGAPVLIGARVLRLLPDATRGYLPYHENSEEYRRRTREYGDRLTVGGINPWLLLTPRQQEIDRALKAEAFDSLAELLQDYGFSSFDMSAECTFEVKAGPVARIEASAVAQRAATVSVRLASGLRPERFHMTLRNVGRNKDPDRRTLSAQALEWTAHADHSVGRATFAVPQDALTECRVLYADFVQDSRLLLDPAAAPNLRRVAVELNDPGLVALTKVLTTIRERDDTLRNEFEASVAVLFYLLGFEAVRISGNRRATDGPDIYALAANNELLVIESTSGAFSEEKCAKLLTRIKSAREAWSRARPDLENAQVTGILVTARKRDELLSQVTALEKQGVLLLCQADVAEAIEQTRFAAAPQEILDRWRRRALREVMTQGLAPSTD